MLLHNEYQLCGTEWYVLSNVLNLACMDSPLFSQEAKSNMRSSCPGHCMFLKHMHLNSDRAVRERGSEIHHEVCY